MEEFHDKSKMINTVATVSSKEVIFTLNNRPNGKEESVIAAADAAPVTNYCSKNKSRMLCLDAKKLETKNVISKSKDMGEFTSTLSTPSIAVNPDVSPLGLKISNVTSLKENESMPISKSKACESSTADESFLQLSTNVLPPYCPPSFPDEFSKHFTSPKNYSCSSCGDTFVLNSSLSFHLQRRSVLIRFSCDSCKGIKIFYNRCALLSHIKSHTEKGEPSSIKNACMMPLSSTENIKDNFVKCQESLSDTLDRDICVLSQTKLSTKESVTGQISEMKDLKFDAEKPITEVKCFECGRNFKSIKLRVDHLTNNDNVPLMISPCNKCSILCPSKCSLKAHQRIHLQINPYVCPECGIILDSSWEIFLKHLKYECFHFSRSIGYKCPVCDKLFITPSILQKHMLDLHTESYFKCQTCPMAFKTSSSFQNHKKTNHLNTNSLCKLIFKCALCDIVFLGKDQMSSHIDFHIKDQMCQYTFNCRECSVSTNSKVELYAHLKNCHEKLLFGETSLGMTTDNINCHVESSSTPASSWGKMTPMLQKVDCILCHCSFLTRQGYNIHVTRAHNNGKQTCCKCGLTLEKRAKMVSHGKKHISGGSVLCLLCHNKEFKDQDSLDIHLFQHVEKINFQSYCPLCDIPLWNVEDAWKHIREEHGLNYSHKRGNLTSPNCVERGDANNKKSRYCHVCKLTFGHWEQWKQHILKAHKLKSHATDSSGGTPAIVTKTMDLHAINRSESESGELCLKKFKPLENFCAKCDFKTECQTTFRNHILKHKSNKSTFQCLECGLCFVVEPSLKKHLKIIHKISDVDKYLVEEGANSLCDNDPPSESQAHNSLECSVCFTMFPTETSLKTHLRSHGMAFIQANKISTS